LLGPFGLSLANLSSGPMATVSENCLAHIERLNKMVIFYTFH
jgi:hypothetical protein